MPQIFIPPGHIPTETYHAADVLFLFDSDLRGGHAPFTADEESLAAAMVGYWARFARAGHAEPAGPPAVARLHDRDRHAHVAAAAHAAGADRLRGRPQMRVLGLVRERAVAPGV